MTNEIEIMKRIVNLEKRLSKYEEVFNKEFALIKISNIYEVIDKVCLHLGVTNELFYVTRALPTIRYRQVLSYILRNEGLTHKSIGEIFKNHHATIMHSCQIIQELLETDNQTKHIFKHIKKIIINLEINE